MMDDPLAALRPLHTPPPIGWWPPAPGWWIVLIGVIVIVWLVYRRRKRMAPKRAALTELNHLDNNRATLEQPVAMLNRLLKRYALVCWPAHDVAALSGQTWLDFLDAHGGNGQFAHGPGQALQTAPYQPRHADIDALIALARSWIKTNTPQKTKHA